MGCIGLILCAMLNMLNHMREANSRQTIICSWHFEYVVCLAPSNVLPYGLVVRIPGFHPGGPGSIPGLGVFLSLSMKYSIQHVFNGD